jgi:prepilin-type processing-associated H-X9-DG protein
LKILQCPSAEANREAIGSLAFAAGGTGACIDYAPVSNVHPDLQRSGLVDAVAIYQGVLCNNTLIRHNDIPDGTCNTIAMSENGARSKYYFGRRLEPDQQTPGGPWASPVNWIWVKGSSYNGIRSPGPCAINCNSWQDVYSFHVNGANVLFMDGRVDFLRADIDIRIFAGMVTRKGGEVISGSDF